MCKVDRCEGAVVHLRNGDGEVMTSKWSCAGGRPVTRVCLKRVARHAIASVVLLTRMSTCAPRRGGGVRRWQ